MLGRWIYIRLSHYCQNLALLKWKIEKLKSYKYLGTDQIPAKLIKAGDEILCSEINKLVCSIWNKEELPQQWKESIIVSIYRMGDKT
jgi:hypothetical protein